MRKFRIHLNGKTYEVAVEEIGEAGAGVLPEGRPSREAVPLTAVPGVSKGDEIIRAPLPGKVLGIHVETGQKVMEGDLILSMEAMKMQSEIFCGSAGMVKKILVQEGDAVNAGDVMVIIG